MIKFKKTLAVLIALVFVLSSALSVYCASSVTYDKNAGKFIFAPGSDKSLTDLFSEYKGVMPGDVLTDTISVRNPTSNGVKINVYLKYAGADEASKDLLSQLKLTAVAQDGKELYAGTLDNPGTLADWVNIGTVYSGGEVLLNLKLEVPLTLGNELQDKFADINWQFKVEELPVEESDPQPPQTNDTFDMTGYVIIGIASLAVITGAVVLLTKKKKEQ